MTQLRDDTQEPESINFALWLAWHKRFKAIQTKQKKGEKSNVNNTLENRPEKILHS